MKKKKNKKREMSEYERLSLLSQQQSNLIQAGILILNLIAMIVNILRA